MSIVSDSNETAKKTADPSADPFATLLEDIATLQRDVEQHIPRILATAKRVQETILAQRRTVLSEASPLPVPFAVRSDGALLLCARDLVDRDISDREQWSAIVLTSEEKSLVFSRADDFAQEAAAVIAATLRKKDRQEDE